MDNSKKEDWNEKVRKSTVHRDPIGSTRASIIRKDRRSLKRHILEAANQGLQMDTEKLLRKTINHLRRKLFPINVYTLTHRIQSQVIRSYQGNTCGIRQVHGSHS